MARWKELLAVGVALTGFTLLVASQPKGDPRDDAAQFSFTFGPFVLALAWYGVQAWDRRTWRPLKEYGTVLLGGLIAGLPLGVGARIGMRLVALARGQTPKFSVSGSLEVLLIFALFGASLALFYVVLLRRWLPGRAIGYGLLLALLTWYPFAREAARDLRTTLDDPTVLAAATLFALALWLPYGMALETALGRLSRCWLGLGGGSGHTSSNTQRVALPVNSPGVSG